MFGINVYHYSPVVSKIHQLNDSGTQLASYCANECTLYAEKVLYKWWNVNILFPILVRVINHAKFEVPSGQKGQCVTWKHVTKIDASIILTRLD